MEKWVKRGLTLLEKSLNPLPQELNELDWKSGLSTKSDRLAQHISAFSNLEEGGYIVFGIDNSGEGINLTQNDVREAVKKMGNIARDSVTPGRQIKHSVERYKDNTILIVFIPESLQKPVHLRKGGVYDSYIRSAGQTRKMTKDEIVQCIRRSSKDSFEYEIAKKNVSEREVLDILDYSSYFRILNKSLPKERSGILNVFCSDGLTVSDNGKYSVTNLGAILFANDIENFETVSRKAIRVVVYEGKNRLNTIKEQKGTKGYATGFEGLVSYINDQLPRNEIVEKALREEVKMYPEIAIRELVANSLIHQDFYEVGTGPMVEIFDDRVEITNPGRPLIDTLRFLDHSPKSRNEKLASVLRLCKVCEERGSGIDKVVSQTELFQLPAPSFLATENSLKATLYSYRELREMDKEDKIRACYLHCCLKHVSNSSDRMTNQSVRERFKISDTNYPMASRIINDTIEKGLIKQTKPNSRSRRYASYIPFWA